MWISWKYQTGQNWHKKENSVKLLFQRPEPLNQTSKKVNFFDGPWKYVEKSLFTLISSFSLIQKYFKEVLSKIVCNLLVHLLNITYLFYGISHPLCILIKNMLLVIRYTCLGIAKLIAICYLQNIFQDLWLFCLIFLCTGDENYVKKVTFILYFNIFYLSKTRYNLILSDYYSIQIIL